MSAALALLVVLAAAPDPQAIAEVAPTAEGAAALRSLDADAQVAETTPRVQLWRLSRANAGLVLAALDAKLPGHFAVVVRDGPKTRVPVGGVMVWLKPGADAAKLPARVVRDFGKGVLLLDAAPGAATLNLSEALAADPRVARAMPNWWLRAVKR